MVNLNEAGHVVIFLKVQASPWGLLGLSGRLNFDLLIDLSHEGFQGVVLLCTKRLFLHSHAVVAMQ